MSDDLNARDNEGNTPIDLAAADYNVEMVKLLLKHKAAINGGSKGFSVPLRVAVLNDKRDVTEVGRLGLGAG